MALSHGKTTVLGGLAAALLGLLYWSLAPTVDIAPVKAPRTGRLLSAPAGLAQLANTGTLASLPDSLAGTSVPHLPIENGGHLAHSHEVRDFFDYFLTTQDATSAPALDQLVRKSIAAQLDGIPAATEALMVWQHYQAYRAALAQLPQAASPTTGQIDFETLQLAIEQRSSLGERIMGDWSEAFFGDQLQRTRTDLARLRIMSNATLSAAEKSARIAALDAALSPEERAARELVQKQQASITALSQLQRSGASLDAVRAQVTQTLGPEAAERVVQMQQSTQAWQNKYADYAAQRAQIDQLNLSPQDRQIQVAQLRQQFFTDPGEAIRAASLDQGTGN